MNTEEEKLLSLLIITIVDIEDLDEDMRVETEDRRD